MKTRGRPSKPKEEKSVRVTVTIKPDLLLRAKSKSRNDTKGLSGLVSKALEAQLD